MAKNRLKFKYIHTFKFTNCLINPKNVRSIISAEFNLSDKQNSRFVLAVGCEVSLMSQYILKIRIRFENEMKFQNLILLLFIRIIFTFCDWNWKRKTNKNCFCPLNTKNECMYEYCGRYAYVHTVAHKWGELRYRQIRIYIIHIEMCRVETKWQNIRLV